MTIRQLPLDACAARAAAKSGHLDWVWTAYRRTCVWLRTCDDYLCAAAMYDHLRALSDAELARRGLSRETLAGEVCAACQRE
jgi:hypothetical protein